MEIFYNSLTQQMKLVGWNDLLRKKISNDLYAVLSAIDVVAQEEEIGRSQIYTHTPQCFFETYQISEVSMNITYVVYVSI